MVLRSAYSAGRRRQILRLKGCGGCRAALQKGLESRGKFFDEMQATKVIRNRYHKPKRVCEKESRRLARLLHFTGGTISLEARVDRSARVVCMRACV